MAVRIDAHARERMEERGASEQEVVETITFGMRFPAKFGRIGFRRQFAVHTEWRGRIYGNKEVEAFAVQHDADWLVVTVITRYY